ncbi:uncharacterized protein [Diadema setosum]|uniref:uncharacterized protein n=1 Tax=Diadema setosum TaxID=31175 RepID=UPI003B3B5892
MFTYPLTNEICCQCLLLGQYRDCVPSREVLTDLARHIPTSEAVRLCKVLDIDTEQSDRQSDNDVLELLVKWVEQGKENSRNLFNKLAPESEQEFRKRMHKKLSDKVYDAGFINLANEIMTGIKHGKVTQLTNSSSPTEQQHVDASIASK